MIALQNLEELFMKFQRLNQILKDNWNDGTQEAFDGNYLTPMATEWSRYHSAVHDMVVRLRSTQREINEEIDELERKLDAMSCSDCSLSGDAVYGIHLTRDVRSVERHFIVPQDELNFVDDSSLCMMVMERFPTFDEYDSPHVIENISIF